MTQCQDPQIGFEAANHVLWHFGRGGYMPGSFFRQLITTIAAADPDNRARLALGFPEHVAAVNLVQNERDGVAQLRMFGRSEQ